MMAKFCDEYNDHKHYRSFVTTVSQLKIRDFSGQNFKRFEVLQYSMRSKTT